MPARCNPSPSSDPATEQGRTWSDTAAQYARDFGWAIVPLHVNPRLAEEEAEDPVVQQVGYLPLVEVPEGASARPEHIHEWGRYYPTAPIAVLTGKKKSGLCALEVPHDAADTSLSSRKLHRLHAVLPETKLVLGPDRDYYLFTLSSTHPSLPPLTRVEPASGLVLHGEHSLARLPGTPSRGAQQANPYRWELTCPEQCAPLPEKLLLFFGIRADGHVLADGNGEQNAPSASAQAPRDTSNQSSAAPARDGSRSDLAFQTGSVLQTTRHPDSSSSSLRDGKADGGASWLPKGAFSVLSGPSKTAGKSTFALNLAVHQAGGRSYLGRELRASSVVLLSDFPERRFQTLLRQLSVPPDTLSRLHVLHPRSAPTHSWRTILHQSFERVAQTGADLLVIDSLDQYVRLKSGVDPTRCQELAHMLGMEAPSTCAVLAVKALPTRPPVRIRKAIPELGLLGATADVVIQMDEAPTNAHPTLRLLQFAGRTGSFPTHLLCELVRGRYQLDSGERASLASPGEMDRSGPNSARSARQNGSPSPLHRLNHDDPLDHRRT